MNILSQLPWTEQKKIAAWQSCRPIQGVSPADYRIDAHGNLIVWDHHGKQGEYGWEVDHIIALALGGADSLANVRALHWRANRKLGANVGNALRRADDLNTRIANALLRR
ncbi:HNH endonuclease signature motif containing protein [Caulobacter sp. UC70_42]|uniref:HNH endonuclease signature motif containing protein n=1 Tax=Caulobacter sp. UC70_42 TaxID=3374551 RepID=UPI003757E430